MNTRVQNVAHMKACNYQCPTKRLTPIADDSNTQNDKMEALRFEYEGKTSAIYHP
jgi:hypothetical protein